MTVFLLVLFVALIIADCWTTAVALERPDIEESSPVPRWLFNRFGVLPTMIAMKILLVAFFAYALFSHPRLRWESWLKWSVIALLLGGAIYVTQNNLRLLRPRK